MEATYGPREPILPMDHATDEADWWITWQTGAEAWVCRAFDADFDFDVDLKDLAAFLPESQPHIK